MCRARSCCRCADAGLGTEGRTVPESEAAGAPLDADTLAFAQRMLQLACSGATKERAGLPDTGSFLIGLIWSCTPPVGQRPRCQQSHSF